MDGGFFDDLRPYSSRAQSNIEIKINSIHPKYLLFDESPALFDCHLSWRWLVLAKNSAPEWSMWHISVFLDSYLFWMGY